MWPIKVGKTDTRKIYMNKTQMDRRQLVYYNHHGGVLVNNKFR